MSTVTTADVRATPGRGAPQGGVQSGWPLERVLFLMAGTMTALSVVLAVLVSPWFLLLTAFVGVNQLAFVAFGNCPSSWLLRRYAGLRGAGEGPR
ncbi:MAG: DUF2892 domain-containing protein [Solirubrobacterales bacterium]